MDLLRYLIRLEFIVSEKDLSEIPEVEQFPEDQFIIDVFGGYFWWKLNSINFDLSRVLQKGKERNNFVSQT